MAEEEVKIKTFEKTCSFDEIERVFLVRAIDSMIDSGVKGWVAIKALMSVKSKAEFSTEELEVIKLRSKKLEPRIPIAPIAPIPTIAQEVKSGPA